MIGTLGWIVFGAWLVVVLVGPLVVAWLERDEDVEIVLRRKERE